MKNLDLNQMENLEGGELLASDAVCAGLGFAWGLANPILGLAVGLGCTYFWDDVEGSNPVLIP